MYLHIPKKNCPFFHHQARRLRHRPNHLPANPDATRRQHHLRIAAKQRHTDEFNLLTFKYILNLKSAKRRKADKPGYFRMSQSSPSNIEYRMEHLFPLKTGTYFA